MYPWRLTTSFRGILQSLAILISTNILIFASHCTLCPGTENVPFPDVVVDGAVTCQVLANRSKFESEESLTCLEYYRYLGVVNCGCPIKLPVSPVCTLCDNEGERVANPEKDLRVNGEDMTCGIAEFILAMDIDNEYYDSWTCGIIQESFEGSWECKPSEQITSHSTNFTTSEDHAHTITSNPTSAPTSALSQTPQIDSFNSTINQTSSVTNQTFIPTASPTISSITNSSNFETNQTAKPTPTEPPVTVSIPLSEEPTNIPTSPPSRITLKPSLTSHPSFRPTDIPTVLPSVSLQPTSSINPSSTPSALPSASPSATFLPSAKPSQQPSKMPSTYPSSLPTFYPSQHPSLHPTVKPTLTPSASPTMTAMPSDKPSAVPSLRPSAFVEKKPNCTALLLGVEQVFPDSVKSSKNAYQMDLALDSDAIIEDVIESFQESMQRVISAEAAGCSELNKNETSLFEEEKIHIVRFSRLATTGGKNFYPMKLSVFFSLSDVAVIVSCSLDTSMSRIGGDICVVTRGHFEIIYSTVFTSDVVKRKLTASMESKIIELMNEKAADGSVNVEGMQEIRVEATTYRDLDGNINGAESDNNPNTTRDGNKIAIGVGAGCACMAFIALAIIIRGRMKAKQTGETEEIIALRHIRSDDSVSNSPSGLSAGRWGASVKSGSELDSISETSSRPSFAVQLEEASQGLEATKNGVPPPQGESTYLPSSVLQDLLTSEGQPKPFDPLDTVKL